MHSYDNVSFDHFHPTLRLKFSVDVITLYLVLHNRWYKYKIYCEKYECVHICMNDYILIGLKRNRTFNQINCDVHMFSFYRIDWDIFFSESWKTSWKQPFERFSLLLSLWWQCSIGASGIMICVLLYICFFCIFVFFLYFRALKT